jgi:type VI protein secretion system component VasF
MTREDFRRELGDAFDAISGSPDPALSNRVRSALVEAPERRGPVWIGALAAAVIAVILVGVLLLGNPLNRGPLVSGGPGTPTATPTPAASPSPTPVP